MDLGLADRAYIVTGGSGGLGLAVAECLVADDAHVLLSGRDQERVDDAVAGLGERARGVAADNADPATPGRLIEAARSAFGRLDGALISVGGPVTGRALDVSDEDWTAAYHAVFLGGLRLGREIGRVLPSGGALAFVLSSSVKSPIAHLAVSNGLRPGLAMVAKTLADELGPAGVRVNGLLPGRIETDRVRWLDAQTPDPEATRRAALGSIPLDRYGMPDEFGRVGAFLLSPAASFVSGVMVPVDGGALRTI